MFGITMYIVGKEKVACKFVVQYRKAYYLPMKNPIALILLPILCPFFLMGLLTQSASVNEEVITQIEELGINNGTHKIYGIKSAPKEPEQKGVAIISHGFNGTHHFGRDYFDMLNKLGYIVYTFDFPCGSVNSFQLWRLLSFKIQLVL